jgi:hypothetical protein
LIACDCGILSFIPFLGLFAGIPGFILGIVGRSHRRANPAIKGAVHAWIGIVLGGLTSLLWGGLIVLMIIGAARL